MARGNNRAGKVHENVAPLRRKEGTCTPVSMTVGLSCFVGHIICFISWARISCPCLLKQQCPFMCNGGFAVGLEIVALMSAAHKLDCKEVLACGYVFWKVQQCNIDEHWFLSAAAAAFRFSTQLWRSWPLVRDGRLLEQRITNLVNVLAPVLILHCREMT